MGQTIDHNSLITDCLKQKIINGKQFDLNTYLKDKGVSDELISQISKEITKIEAQQHMAKSRIQEGSVITAIGLGGVGYAFTHEKDGTVWLLWTLAGLGVLANGLWKRKNINRIKKP